jgi:hypothetical protein
MHVAEITDHLIGLSRGHLDKAIPPPLAPPGQKMEASVEALGRGQN